LVFCFPVDAFLSSSPPSAHSRSSALNPMKRFHRKALSETNMLHMRKSPDIKLQAFYFSTGGGQSSFPSNGGFDIFNEVLQELFGGGVFEQLGEADDSAALDKEIKKMEKTVIAKIDKARSAQGAEAVDK
jgi:hypothetical protein